MYKNKLIFLIIFVIIIYYHCLPFSCKIYYSKFMAIFNISFLKNIICNFKTDKRKLKDILIKRFSDKTGNLKSIIQ